MAKHVIILGGGVAGMSAAHELIERDFQVTVFEKRASLPGGKARSVPVPETGTEGSAPLPGEHGFRFFPGFYRHMFHTLKRIPFDQNPEGKAKPGRVFDNLVECPQIMLARRKHDTIRTPSHFPRSLKDLKQILHNLQHTETGLEPGEARVILEKIWQLCSSCTERWEDEYERMGWREFTEANYYSESYNTLFVGGLTGSLVAGKAETANTRTNGKILIQILSDIVRPFRVSDRILNAPTNEAWLQPWYEYLTHKDVDYRFDAEAVGLICEHGALGGVWIREGNEKKKYTADYYLCALPVERAAELIDDKAVLILDPELRNIILLRETVAWMNGIQFYLRHDVPLNEGHIILPDTPWALTAISQAQFWKNVRLPEYGNGKVKGILSVIISDWTKPGLRNPAPARECSRGAVIEEVWYQLKACFNLNGQEVLKDEMLELVYVAESIYFPGELFHKSLHRNTKLDAPSRYGSKEVNRNDEPLLVNEKNTWALRNESYTAIPNFFLASDYVRTHTNLATMEGANEAARRAVNNIIDAAGLKVPHCRVWPLKEPFWLGWYKWLDKRRYQRGLPWKMHKPWFAAPLGWLLRLFGIKLFT